MDSIRHLCLDQVKGDLIHQLTQQQNILLTGIPDLETDLGFINYNIILPEVGLELRICPQVLWVDELIRGLERGETIKKMGHKVLDIYLVFQVLESHHMVGNIFSTVIQKFEGEIDKLSFVFVDGVQAFVDGGCENLHVECETGVSQVTEGAVSEFESVHLCIGLRVVIVYDFFD